MGVDIFISHASEDKAAVAEPLARLLISHGHRVWLDKFELTVGDSLRERIDSGLAKSRFGIVVLSKHFFNKEWPLRELNALYAKATSGEKVVLPVWHDIDRDEILQYSPLLADCLGVRTDQGLEKVVIALLRAIEHALASDSSTPNPYEAPPPTYTATADSPHSAIRTLQVGGALSKTAVYVERSTDRDLMQRLERKCEGLITLRARRTTGKTSLVARLSSNLCTLGYSIARIDMASFYGTGPSELLRAIESSIVSELGLAPSSDVDPSVETFERFLHGIHVPTVVILDEADAMPPSSLAHLMSALRSVARAQLRIGGNVSILVVFEPGNESLTETILGNGEEIGHHFRLPSFSLSETMQLFQLARVEVSAEQASEVQALTGGNPWLTQAFARELARGKPVEQVCNSMLGGGHLPYELRRLLGRTSPGLIQRILDRKAISEAEAWRLGELDIIALTSNGWRFTSQLIERYCEAHLAGSAPQN